jgi:FtsP/CotA-like multicopper oxidase with cupredoxin domain
MESLCNGVAPGPEIRVKQGDKVVVNFTNKLPVPATVHWNGVNVPNGEDGISVVTQVAVKPGGTFTYTFIADQPGISIGFIPTRIAPMKQDTVYWVFSSLNPNNHRLNMIKTILLFSINGILLEITPKWVI